MANPTEQRKIFALVLDCDEYHHWVGFFDERSDADAAAKLGNDNRADQDDYRRFYVSEETIYGATLDLATIKGLIDEYSIDDDPLWKVEDEPELPEFVPSPGQLPLREES